MITSKILPKSNLRFLSHPAIARAQRQIFVSHPHNNLSAFPYYRQGSTVQNRSNHDRQKIVRQEPEQGQENLCNLGLGRTRTRKNLKSRTGTELKDL